MILRNAFYLFLLGIMAASSSSAQSKWDATGPQEQIIDITSNDGNVYVLGSDGLYVSSDDKSWQKIRPTQAGEYFNSVVVLNPGELFLFSYSSYVTSSDSGATWKEVKQSGFSTRRCVADNLGYLYSGQDDPIQLSTDKGVTWKASQNGTSGNFFDIAAFAFAPDGAIYAGNQGITGGLVYRSSNHGTSWQLVHNESMEDVGAITIHDSTIWIAYSDRLLYSNDNGKNWSTALTTPEAPITTILFTEDNEGYDGRVSQGLFYSGDSGISWSNNEVGIHGSNISKILVSPKSNVLVGTDSGLFILNSQSTVNGGSQVQEKMTLFPNPAQNEVKVAFDSANAITGMELFDEFGRKIMMLQNKINNQDFSINTASLKRGTYFVVVNSAHGKLKSKLELVW